MGSQNATTYTGSISGTASCTMPRTTTGNKFFFVRFHNLTDAGGNIVFPFPFLGKPTLGGTNGAAKFASTTSAMITLSATSNLNGWIWVKGQ